MKNAILMEWLIGAFVGNERATAMIGDLLETKPGGIRFWCSSLALLVSVVWRPLAALLVAYASIYLTWVPAFHGSMLASRHMWVDRAGVITWAPNASSIMRQVFWAYVLGALSMLECISAFFAYVLYGFRDALTIVGAVLGGLSIALCWYLWSPGIGIGLACGLAAVTVAFAASPHYRNALAIFAGALFISCGLGCLLMKWASSLHYLPANFVAIGIIPLINVFMISQLHRNFGERIVRA